MTKSLGLLVTIVISILMTSASNLVWADEDFGYYAGLDIAAIGPRGELSASNGTTQAVKVTTPVKLTIGYHFRSEFAIELGYVNFNSEKSWMVGDNLLGVAASTTGSIKQNSNFIPLLIVWNPYFTPELSASFKLGAGLLTTKFDYVHNSGGANTTASSSNSFTVANAGASLNFDVTPSISAVIGFDLIPQIEYKMSDRIAKSTLYSTNAYVGARYAF